MSVLPPATSQTSDEPKIETIEIRGNPRIPTDTIKYNIQTKTGTPLNPEIIRRDIKTLYAQGFFDDIRVEEADGRNGGIVVIFTVSEKKLIRSVDFAGISTISKSDILEKMKERKIGLSQESPFDPAGVKKVEGLIKSMLAEKGRKETGPSDDQYR